MHIILNYNNNNKFALSPISNCSEDYNRFRLVAQRTPRILQGEMSKKVYFSIEQN